MPVWGSAASFLPNMAMICRICWAKQELQIALQIVIIVKMLGKKPGRHMSAVHDVLKDEYERLKALEGKYVHEIAMLPRGSVTKKDRNRKFYFYLVYRQKQKIITQYIGKEGSQKTQEILEQVEKRKQLEDKLKQVQKNLKELKRALNGKKI